MSKITKGLRKQAKKEKKAVKKARKEDKKSRYVECSSKVSICHIVPVNLQYPSSGGGQNAPELQAQARDECLALLKPSRSAYCYQP
jgi:hypothetical protein